MSVKSPYNFVPISNRVYFPKWGDQVTQDIPFSDQKSGKLKIQFRAESPIYIKNGGDNGISFSKFKNEYFIPGTSIKGAIRNILEIISFSKMNSVDNRKYSWRDLNNPDYSSRFTKDFNSEPKVQAGFIQEIGNQWYLIPAKMARIEQFELDENFGVKKELLSAKDKYVFWLGQNKKLENKFDISEPGINVFIKQCGKFRRAQLNPKGKVKGTLVFTGQIQPRNFGGEGKHGKNRKHLEFVFFDRDDKRKMLINNEMRRNFELNHSRERNLDNHKLAKAPNDEWNFWKPRLAKGHLMPVFWLSDGKGKVDSFGLAMLYRLPYKNSIHDLLPKEHLLNKLDFAELIFGTIDGPLNLKGRVQFSRAKALGYVEELLERKVVLSSPKATFYPYYIRQDTTKSYKTYNHDSAVLAGRKRYPIHKKDVPVENYHQSMEKLSTKIKPLQKGTLFKMDIMYYNLKPVELGALFSALTFHAHQDRLFHSLGMGKSLGYGKIKLISIESTEKVKNIIKYMRLFEKTMDSFLGGDGSWKNSEQIKELFLMSAESTIDDKLVYMSLEEYLNIKANQKQGQSLHKYSKISGKSFILDDDIRENILSKLIKVQIEKRNSSKSELEKVQNMTITQFKKYLKLKVKTKDYEPTILEILKLENSGLADYLKKQLNKKDGEISKYLQLLLKKFENI